eukprot:CAMPEP_0173179022 /NCGR_PEP_ID=MMETSP1141-20130122/5876_1 /TAXON_ID=483371 /ORGANISM="non described non described, Strain CCMP2298" /LENGTH=30 /DNA_ID= /DNA_START= /DNA_END= /DNA_ORIENTATION=
MKNTPLGLSTLDTSLQNLATFAVEPSPHST